MEFRRDPTTDIDLALLAFDAAPLGIVLTENRVIRACNQTFCTMFGFRRTELLGQSFRLLYASRQEFEQIRDIGLKRLQEKGHYTDERIVQDREGNRFWCRFRAHTLTRDVPLARTVLSFAALTDGLPEVKMTLRERQVVLWLSKGLTSKQIARELMISPRTVEDFRSRLLKKFQAKNTTELLAQLTGMDY